MVVGDIGGDSGGGNGGSNGDAATTRRCAMVAAAPRARGSGGGVRPLDALAAARASSSSRTRRSRASCMADGGLGATPCEDAVTR